MNQRSTVSGGKPVYWLLGWLLAATFVIAFLLSLWPGATWLLSLKDVAILLFLLLGWKGWLPFALRLPWWLWGIALIMAIHLLWSPAPLMACTSAARQLLMPFLLFFVGLASVQKAADADGLKRWMLRAAFVLIGLGFLFYLVPFWHFFSLKPYAAAKHIWLPEGQKYLTMFVEPVGDGIPRMISTLLDPINLGHLLVFVLAVGFYERRLKSWQLLLLAVALALTFCKGAFLQLFLLFLLQAPMPRWLRWLGWALAGATLLAGAKLHPGILMHLHGLIAGLKTATLQGYGLGMTGNQAAMYGRPLELGIGDTFIGAVIGQLGIIGLLLWLLPFAVMVRQLRGQPLLRNLLIAQLIVAVLSENAFNLMSILFLMVTIGATFKTIQAHAAEHRDH